MRTIKQTNKLSRPVQSSQPVSRQQHLGALSANDWYAYDWFEPSWSKGARVRSLLSLRQLLSPPYATAWRLLLRTPLKHISFTQLCRRVAIMKRLRHHSTASSSLILWRIGPHVKWSIGLGCPPGALGGSLRDAECMGTFGPSTWHMSAAAW